MAERRMFAKTIIDSDAFLDMPLSAQALYFHLSMRADDDGFINNPRKIQRSIGCGNDDMKLLVAKNFIIPFESGIVVIKHWKIHNYIQRDRYKPTVCEEEKKQLGYKQNKEYYVKSPDENDMDTPCIQDASGSDTQVRLGKVRLGKSSIETEVEGGMGGDDQEPASPLPSPSAVVEPVHSADPEAPEKPIELQAPKNEKPVKHKYGEHQKVLLTDKEFADLKKKFGPDLTTKLIIYLDEYIADKGYKSKSHYLAIHRWVVDAVREREERRGRARGAPVGPNGVKYNPDKNDLDDVF